MNNSVCALDEASLTVCFDEIIVEKYFPATMKSLTVKVCYNMF